MDMQSAGVGSTRAFNLGDFVISQDGAVYVCTTAGSPGTWKSAADKAPRGMVGSVTGPASQTDATSLTAVLNLAVTLVAGRRYRAAGFALITQVTNAGAAQVTLGDSASLLPANVVRPIYVSLTANAVAAGSAFWTFVAASSGSVTFSLYGNSSAAACRFGANQSQLIVEDLGT